MLLQTMQVGPIGVNCYIARDEIRRDVVVIDPGGNAREIVLTHAHFDHVMGVAEVKRATGAPLMAGGGEAKIYNTIEGQAKFFGLAVTPPPNPEHWLREKDIVQAGDVKFQVIETPGHSPRYLLVGCWRRRVVFRRFIDARNDW